MNTLNTIKSAIASDIYQLPNVTFDLRQDNEQHLLSVIEDNGYCQACEIGSTYEAWNLLWSDLSREVSFDKPDFSSCTSSFQCLEMEAQELLNAAYYEATQDIVKNIADAIDECFNHDFGSLELTEMFIGKSGLGHISHDYETDIAHTSLCVWVASKMVEITVEGVTLYGVLTEIEDN